MGEIRFNRPSVHGRELEYIQQAVAGGHTSMKGPFTRQVNELLARSCGSIESFLTTSCTDALEMSAMLLNAEPDDVVVVPSFTFVSTALAFVRQGFKLRFCDIEPVTLGLDAGHLNELMDDRVRAVVTVHYAGVGSELHDIQAVLDRWPGAALIEDNAHGLFGTYDGRPLGSFGRFSTLSFHETKNFTCGEGGALLVNRHSDIDRAHVLLDKGTNRRQFMLGQVDKYSWHDLGSSFGLSDLLAAYLYGQLEEREAIMALRRGVWERYRDHLEPLSQRFDIRLPVVPANCTQAYHMFYVLLPDRQTRDGVLADMCAGGIHPTFHYVPLHSSPGGMRFAADPASDCPVTDDISGRLLRLPFFNELDDRDCDRVVTAFESALAHRA